MTPIAWRYRAATRDEIVFAAQLVDGLTLTLQTVDPACGPEKERTS